MNDHQPGPRLQLLLQHASDCQQTLSEIAHRFEIGGKDANAAIAELKSALANQVRGVLHALVNETGAGFQVCEIGAKLLCTAVRASEFVFTRDERVIWFDAFRLGANHFKEPGLKGRLLGNFGNALADCGRLNEAEVLLKERLQCAEDEKNQEAKGLAKEHLGKLLLRRGRFREADQYLEEAFAIATSLAEETTVTRLLKDMADAAFRRAETDAGIRYLEERLKRCEAAGDSLLILSTSQILAERLAVFDQLDQSKIYAAKASMVAKQLRLPMQLAAIQGTLGNIAYEERQFDVAHRHFTIARKIFRKLNRIVAQAMTATSLGLVAWKQGKLKLAIRWFRESLEIDKAAGRQNDAAIDLGNLANVLTEIGDYKAATACYSERIDILDANEEHQRAAETRMTLAKLHAANGQFSLAIKTSELALAHYSRQDQEPSEDVRFLIAQWNAS